MNFERSFSGFLFLSALLLIYLAWGYTAPISYDPLGPRPYPILILSLLAFCSLLLILKPKQKTSELGYTTPMIKKLAFCLLAMFAYSLLFELLGFPLATALMAFVIGKLFGGTSTACAISSIALGAGFYLLFDMFLDVPLPLGFFG